jgi:hypothetical protein
MRVDETDADFPIVITTMPANARHHKIATGGLIIVVAVIATIMPFAAIRLPRVDAFIPVIQTLMCVGDLLTAALLFAHYRVQPQSALLALAGGFVTSGLFAFLHTLAFPEAYDAGVLIGDRLNSAGWLFIFWHTVFPLAVIFYTLWKDKGDAVPWTRRSTRVALPSPSHARSRRQPGCYGSRRQASAISPSCSKLKSSEDLLPWRGAPIFFC